MMISKPYSRLFVSELLYLYTDMRFKVLFSIFSVGVVLATSPPRNSFLAAESRLLESELALARGEAAYVLIDTGSKTLSLNANGLVLRKWTIVKSRRWGFPFSAEAASLLKKSTLLPPKREEIKPGETEHKDTFDIQALELSDMPGRFSLVLEKGIRISVAPSPRGFAKLFGFSVRGFRRLLLYPLKTVVAALGRKNFHVLEVELESKEEAQALYWTLEPGTPFLLFPQSN
jgi:hypothetical protein